MATSRTNPDQRVEIQVAQPRANVRSEQISRSLRDVAKLARDPATIWLGVSGVKSRWQSAFIWGTFASFILLVAIPIITASVYLGLIASDQYVSEARFAVRGGERPAFDLGSSLNFLTGLPAAQRVQDSLILYEYIRGRGVVEDLDRTADLRQVFGRPSADYFSRFDTSDSIEELVKYWRKHVYVGYDTMSNTITLIVPGFTPEDALNISRKVIDLSEKLVNELSERARRDALLFARSSLTRAQDNLEAKIKALRDLRNSEGVLDASKTADVVTKMVAALQLELIHLQQEYDIQRRSVSANSPQLQVQEARIASMRDQIRRLEMQMTDGGGGASTLAASMSRFDRLQLERDIAEKQYAATASAFEAARVQLESQQVYLATFLQPVLAQEALYPRRWWLLSIVMVACLALWGSIIGIGVLVRNYIAV